VSRRPTTTGRCSICRSGVEGAGLTYRAPSLPGRPGRDVGVYCGERCRDAARALGVLTEPPPFMPRPIIERRNEIADGLLALWRRRAGPDPLLVIAAAERVNAPRSALVR